MIERYCLRTGDKRSLCDEHAEARAAELKFSICECSPSEPCDDCQEIAARPERRLLQKAIEAVEELIDDEPEALGSRFIDTGCNECTEGCTPASFDRGPCWRHAAKKLLAGAVVTNETRRNEIRAAVVAAVMELADSVAGERVAFIDAATLSVLITGRLDLLIDANLI